MKSRPPLSLAILPLLRVLLLLAGLLLAGAAGLALSSLQASAADDLKALAERGQWKRLRAALAAAPAGDAESAWLQSRVKQAFGDLPAALALAEQAVKLAPGNADYHLQLAEVVGPMARKAGPLKGLSMGKRFKKEVETAIALDPRHIEARIDLMMFHLEAPGIAGGDKKKAALEVEEIARIDPLQGHLARMQWAMARKDSVAAEAALRQAMALGDASFGAHYQAARALIAEKRDPARAERYLRRYLELEPEGFAPTWAHARWRLGLALEQQGKTAAAVQEIEKALAQKPDLDDAKKDLKRLRQGKAVASQE